MRQREWPARKRQKKRSIMAYLTTRSAGAALLVIRANLTVRTTMWPTHKNLPATHTHIYKRAIYAAAAQEGIKLKQIQKIFCPFYAIDFFRIIHTQPWRWRFFFLYARISHRYNKKKYSKDSWGNCSINLYPWRARTPFHFLYRAFVKKIQKNKLWRNSSTPTTRRRPHPQLSVNLRKVFRFVLRYKRRRKYI